MGADPFSSIYLQNAAYRTNSNYIIRVVMNGPYILQVPKSFSMNVGMHHANNRGYKEIPLAILSRILAQSYVANPLPELCREGLRMIVLVSLIVLLRGFPCFHDFRMVHS